MSKHDRCDWYVHAHSFSLVYEEGLKLIATNFWGVGWRIVMLYFLPMSNFHWINRYMQNQATASYLYELDKQFLNKKCLNYLGLQTRCHKNYIRKKGHLIHTVSIRERHRSIVGKLHLWIIWKKFIVPRGDKYKIFQC